MCDQKPRNSVIERHKRKILKSERCFGVRTSTRETRRARLVVAREKETDRTTKRFRARVVNWENYKYKAISTQYYIYKLAVIEYYKYKFLAEVYFLNTKITL